MQYPYLVASFPMMKFESAPPWRLSEFREVCGSGLVPDDLRELNAVLSLKWDQCTSDFAVRYHEANTQLKRAVASVRARRPIVHISDYSAYPAGSSPFFNQAVIDAFTKTNPMERQRVIDRTRWILLEDMALFKEYDLDGILSYGLRLRMAERIEHQEPDVGRKRFREWVDLCSTIQSEEA